MDSEYFLEHFEEPLHLDKFTPNINQINEDPIKILKLDNGSLDKFCRICAKESNQLVSIFGKHELEINLEELIQIYLPLKISKNDTLPLKICPHCIEVLTVWHKTHKCCQEAQKKLMYIKLKLSEQFDDDIINVLNNSNKDKPDMDSESQVPFFQEHKNNRNCDTHDNHNPLLCNCCGKKFYSESELEVHLDKISELKKKMNCREPIENNLIPGELEILDKCRIIEDKQNVKYMYKCYKCAKILGSKKAFLRHFRSHENIKPCACDLCYQSFSIKQDLNTHIRLVHLNIKNYFCKFCDKTFKRKHEKDKHERNHKENLHKCNYCNKSFETNSSKEIHENVHNQMIFKMKSIILPYNCLFCKKGFGTMQEKKRHEILHTDIKPYACSICGRKFALKAEAKRHLLIHGEKNFKCLICNSKFFENRYLLKHIRKHHTLDVDNVKQGL